jgi:hypothetical protein
MEGVTVMKQQKQNRPESTKATPKKVIKPITIRFFEGGSAMFTRVGMPDIIDRADKALAWLMDHDFKASDIEIIAGAKPSCWEDYFPTPPPVVEEPTQEKIAAIFDGTPIVESEATIPVDSALVDQAPETTVPSDSVAEPS